jgi:superfamily II helicase
MSVLNLNWRELTAADVPLESLIVLLAEANEPVSLSTLTLTFAKAHLRDQGVIGIKPVRSSAGKTRVAELVILRFLLDYQDDPQTKCIYIAPFRSLAVEIEGNLRQSFHPLGVRVSELYGGFELSPIERMLMDRTRIVIATPEKIDAFLRYNPDFAAQVRLVIIDEGHIISPTERGIRFEFFLHRLIIRYAAQQEAGSLLQMTARQRTSQSLSVPLSNQ